MIALPANTIEHIILPRLAATGVALTLLLGHSCDYQATPKQPPAPAANPATIDAADSAAMVKVEELNKIYEAMTDKERMRGVVYDPIEE